MSMPSNLKGILPPTPWQFSLKPFDYLSRRGMRASTRCPSLNLPDFLPRKLAPCWSSLGFQLSHGHLGGIKHLVSPTFLQCLCPAAGRRQWGTTAPLECPPPSLGQSLLNIVSRRLSLIIDHHSYHTEGVLRSLPVPPLRGPSSHWSRPPFSPASSLPQTSIPRGCFLAQPKFADPASNQTYISLTLDVAKLGLDIGPPIPSKVCS